MLRLLHGGSLFTCSKVVQIHSACVGVLEAMCIPIRPTVTVLQLGLVGPVGETAALAVMKFAGLSLPDSTFQAVLMTTEFPWGLFEVHGNAMFAPALL